MKKTITRTLQIEDELWLEFESKYPLGMSKRIRELIELDLEGKLNDSQSPPSFKDIRKVKTD
jgi:hypothetical protein